jgi:hypothetical protein
MKQKHLTETPVCPRERLVIISYTTGLSFALERIGPLATIIITVFYLFALYLFALPNTPENPFASIYSESLIKTTCQHLLLLIGFDTVIYQKYYDTPPILVGHHPSAYIFSSSRKTKIPDQFSTKHTASHRRHRREIEKVRKLFLTPCRRGGSPPKAFFITMPAYGVMCE